MVEWKFEVLFRKWNQNHFCLSFLKLEFFIDRILYLNIWFNFKLFIFLDRFKFNCKMLFSLKKIGEFDMEWFDMVLIDFKLCFFLLNLKLWSTIENVRVIWKGLTLELDNKFFFLMDEFGNKCNFDLFFLLWL